MKLYLGTAYFYLRSVLNTLKQVGIVISEQPRFFRDANRIRKGMKASGDFPHFAVYPCLLDRTAEGGTTKGHYFHQDLWVSQQIFKENPVKHVDIGSRVDGFVAHVAAYRFIEVIDVRPINSEIDNMQFVQADMMMENPHLENYCDSMSCLHALEHFGLGRYGDPLDIDGHLKGFASMSKMLKVGGKMYFSVPIGPQRIEFNAHRVFSISYLLKMFAANNYKVDTFCYVDDKGDLHKNVSMANEQEVAGNFGCQWGCGIFKLEKI
ncbi:DUF268 domain-containing protein [Chitinophaga sp.]|uniref:DUF268 domain-containing protein n=1 Tax=Chitinophaga sp. TaxID=1869181 RepID=UPI0031D1C40D